MKKYNIRNLGMLEKVIFLREIELHDTEEKLKKNFRDLKDRFPSYLSESLRHEIVEEMLERFFSKRSK